MTRLSKAEVEAILAPDRPPEYDDTDIAAMQALILGEATPYQQKRALDWIIVRAALTYDQSFRSDGTGRADAFLEGRRFVGNQVIKLTKLTPTQKEKSDGRSGPQG